MNSRFIEPTKTHQAFGVKPIPGIQVLNLTKSKRKHHKYAMTLSYKGVIKTVHFGHLDYQHFQDRSPLHLFEKWNHLDSARRHDYLTRASGIRNKEGVLTCNLPFSANRYAIIVLW